MKKKSTRLNRWKAAMCMAVVASSTAMVGPAHAGYSGSVVTPASLDFGNVPAGTTSAVQTITVSNTYGGPASFSVDALVLPPAYATTGGTCAVGAPASNIFSCTLDIVFQPPAPGVFAGNISVTASTFSAQGTVLVPTTGTGTNFRVVPALSNVGLLLLLAGLGGVGLVVARRH